ncbi:hypothetical protein U0070_002632 [Myodes glareolus]|uniref:Cilia- and flagella-associated protein 58 central coiled coil domain-containing protein n=1 Tax=Myodes glareolus TaxID=447135 RepID=A0AAW0HF01_MYOGA
MSSCGDPKLRRKMHSSPGDRKLHELLQGPWRGKGTLHDHCPRTDLRGSAPFERRPCFSGRGGGGGAWRLPGDRRRAERAAFRRPAGDQKKRVALLDTGGSAQPLFSRLQPNFLISTAAFAAAFKERQDDGAPSLSAPSRFSPLALSHSSLLHEFPDRDSHPTEKGEKLVLEETAFEEIERDFQEVLNELSGDKSLEKFRTEYEKLHTIMRKSYENEKRLMAKCRELNAEIVVNSAKVATALKLSQDDQTTIASLKKEIEKAWKMVDSAYDKEQKAKETILALKEEIVNLTKLVEQGSGLSMDQDSNIRDLLKFKEEVTKERDQLLSEVVKLRENLAQTTEQQQETERAKEDAEQTINQFQQEIQHRQNEASRESRKKEKLEKELKQIQTDMDSRQAEIKALQQYMQRSKEELQRLEQQLKEQKILNERAAKELEQFQIRNSKLQQENEQHTLTCEQLSQENQQKALELKVNTVRHAKEEEVHQMRLDIGKLNKIREQIHKKLHLIEDQKAEVEQHKETLKNQIMGLEREVESSKKQAELDKKAMDELLRERDILNKNMLKALSATQKQVDLVKLHEQAKRNLEEEIQNYKDEAQKQRKIIFQLEKERDRYINEASDLTQKQPRLARILFPAPSFLNSVLSLHLFLTLSSPQKTEAEHARRKTPN